LIGFLAGLSVAVAARPRPEATAAKEAARNARRSMFMGTRTGEWPD
jgi:hypothetical protein